MALQNIARRIRMQIRNVIAAMLCIALAGGAFAAGAAQGGSDAPVELVHYVFSAGDVSDGPEVFALINERLQDRIGATVDFVDVPGGEFEQRIQVVINSGEDYDVTFTSNWRNNYHTNVGKGAFADLTDLLPEFAPTIWNTQQGYIDAAKVAGKIYAVLNEQIFARSRMTRLPYEWADAAGIVPEEYSSRALAGEDIYDLDREMRELLAPIMPEGAVFGALGPQVAWDKTFIVPIIAAEVPGAVQGGAANELEVFNQFRSDEFLELLAYTQELVDDNLIRNTDLTRETESARQILAAGLSVTPIEPGGTYKPGGEEQGAERWQYLYYENQMTPATLTTGGIIATMLAVNSQSENIEKSVEYLEQVFSDDEIYMLFHYGIVGRHYNVTNGFLKVVSGSGYNRGVPWSMGSQFQQLPVEGQPADVWDLTRELNASARKSPELGFAFDPTKVTAEIGQTRSVYTEFVPGLMDGTRPPADYEEFLEKLDDAGAERIIEELQIQIDAWAATR